MVVDQAHRMPLQSLVSRDKSRFRFELPRALLPMEGQDHRVRVFAIRGRVASELAYRGAYPWAHG